MSAPQKKTSGSPSLGEIVGGITFLIGLVSAWLYVTGWTYAYHYFDRFGIPLLMVDLPKETYFVYGGIVVQRFAICALSIGVVGVVAVILWRRFGPKWRWGGVTDKWPRAAGGVFIMIGLAVVFWIGRHAAVAAAYQQYAEQRESDYGAYPRVQVWLKQDARLADTSPLASDDMTRGCYRLLLHNQNRLFLLRPVQGAPAANLPLLTLPWDRIELIRVMPDYSSCR